MEGQLGDILYGVDDNPPWFLTILLAFQQFLTMFGATFAYPLIVQWPLCMDEDWVGVAQLTCTVLTVSGGATLLQATVGTRLPIIQGVSYSFITPIFVVMAMEPARCPYHHPGTVNVSALPPRASPGHRAFWHANLAELQGSLMVASCVQIVIGFTGCIGFLMRFIGPLTIAPTITLIGCSLFGVASGKAESQWYVCLMTIVFMALFSQYLRRVASKTLNVFALFPVLMAVLLAWGVCGVLTVTGVLTDDPQAWGYKARTDIRSHVLHDAEWFRAPYPGQWGPPTVSVGATVGMTAATVASIVESVGHYYACARLAGATPPTRSAVSRGIGVEGLTCLLAGGWGTGAGSTSYSENIGAIGMTKVGSRRVVQAAGLLMVGLGCFGKFGALFVTIPDPVVGGLFYCMFGMVTAVGISNLQCVDLNSSRNLFVFGVSVFSGLSVPMWVRNHVDSIDTGSHIADEVLQVFGGTAMFIGGIVAFILDNTVPGTRDERGFTQWDDTLFSGDIDATTYNIPLIQKYIDKIRCFRYVPFCPGYVHDKDPSIDSWDLEQGDRIVPTSSGLGQEDNNVKVGWSAEQDKKRYIKRQDRLLSQEKEKDDKLVKLIAMMLVLDD